MGRFFFVKKGKKSRGQTLVEFALVLPIFLLMVLGVIEFGRLLAVASSVYSAAREAARYGSASDYYRDCPGIEAAANRVGFFASPLEIKIGYYDSDSNPNVTFPLPIPHDCPDYVYNPSAKAIPRIVVLVTTRFKFLFLNLPEFPISSQSVRTIVDQVAFNETPNIPPGEVAPCSFLSASPGIPDNSHQPFYFNIINGSSSVTTYTIKTVNIQWNANKSPHYNLLTRIDFGAVNLATLNDNSGDYTWSDSRSSVVGTTPLTFNFSLDASNKFTISDSTVTLNYINPHSTTTIYCSLKPGQTAVNIAGPTPTPYP